MGMVASAAEDGKAGGRGSGRTDGEGVVVDEEEDNGEKVHMATESKTGHWSCWGMSGLSKEGSKENMAVGDAMRPFSDVALYL